MRYRRGQEKRSCWRALSESWEDKKEELQRAYQRGKKKKRMGQNEAQIRSVKDEVMVD